jgi:hypothetical protein
MKEKLENLVKTDPLFPHKVGVITGAFVGVLVGMVISAKADAYEVQIIEEEIDGETKL